MSAEFRAAARSVWSGRAVALRCLDWPGRAAQRRQRAAMVAAADGVTVAAGLVAARVIRFQGFHSPVRHAGPPPLALALLLGPLWVASLALRGAYDKPSIGGAGQLRDVVEGVLRFVATAALVLLVVRADAAGGVLVPLLCAGALTVAVHAAWNRQRAGACIERVVIVGTERRVTELAGRVDRAGTGRVVVGACVAGRRRGEHLAAGGRTIPVLGPPAEVFDPRRLQDFDCVIVADEELVSAAHLGDLLRGACVDLLVAPAVVDVPARRADLVPVAGVPLLHLRHGARRQLSSFVAQAVERVVAAVALVGVLPVLVAAAAAVRLTSRGPALFSQVRLGRGGRPFTIFKLRTMRLGAEAERAGLTARNEHDGLLFKMRRDPRVTPVGKVLRRVSIDELPQLWNVVRGDMRLVGPRPALPDEVDRYDGIVSRRLLVKPGLTGLWQVSGRADLPWAEGIDLDLRYVDNQSPGTDLAILFRTVGAVLRGKGAY